MDHGNHIRRLERYERVDGGGGFDSRLVSGVGIHHEERCRLVNGPLAGVDSKVGGGEEAVGWRDLGDVTGWNGSGDQCAIALRRHSAHR